MPETNKKTGERFREDIEQICRETTEALERVTKAQAELVSKATEVMTRGCVGVLNGAVGAVVQGYVGFFDGFSRALERRGKDDNNKRVRKTGSR